MGGAVGGFGFFLDAFESIFDRPGRGLQGFLIHRLGLLDSAAGGVFPFGLGGQAIFLAGLLAEPGAVSLGRAVVDRHTGIPVVAKAIIGGGVGLARAGLADRFLLCLFIGDIE